MIRKTKRGWEVLSHRTGKSLGIYPTKPLAKKRLEQLKRFRKK
jgi:hypothetical protein